MPYPSTIRALREFRHQMLLEEAAHERLASSAARRQVGQEAPMYYERYDDVIVRRGIDEALACQDVLPRAPVTPSQLTRVIASIVELGRTFVRRALATMLPRAPRVPRAPDAR